MTTRFLFVLAGLKATTVVIALVANDTGGGNLNQRGRITLPVDADGVDANGKPVGYSGYCEADAVALLEGSRVAEIKQESARAVAVGETVIRVGADTSYSPVYRDKDGNLREGCAPESQESYQEDVPAQ